MNISDALKRVISKVGDDDDNAAEAIMLDVELELERMVLDSNYAIEALRLGEKSRAVNAIMRMIGCIQ